MVVKKVRTSEELGSVIRSFRKSNAITLEQVSGLTTLGTRFLSELERGKKSAHLGKTLEVLHSLGLEVVIQSRNHETKVAIDE